MPGILTFPLSCFVGLAVAGTEVTVAGYVRQPGTLALCEDGTTYANTTSQQWQHATASWGALDTVQIWDAAVGGALLASLPALAAVTIAQYDIARIPASGLTANYVKTSRPFGTGNYGTFGFGTARAFRGNVFKQRPYGSGLYGSNLYGGYLIGAYLQRAFDQQQHLCAPGTWAPGPFSLAA